MGEHKDYLIRLELWVCSGIWFRFVKKLQKIKAYKLKMCIPILYEDALNYQQGCIWYQRDGFEIAL